MNQDQRSDRFDSARHRLQKLWQSGPARDEALKGVVAILHEELDGYDWVGIYIVQGQELVLHNYLGRPTPHERIPLNKGICGAAVTANESIIVDDVKSDERYLACSLETASEIVVPIRVGARPVAELDIDSDTPKSFDGHDQAFLEEIAQRLSSFFADALETQPGGMRSPFA